ncbi:MAG: HNH endonuclease [Chloroflexota bacterium]|nr:HNH endonuclease [Chloroflexota bacterium]
MTVTRYTQTSAEERPFASTAEKYNSEHASSKVTVSNFPYDEIQGLPGYSERGTPGLTGSDVAKELAKHLTDYAAEKGCPLLYRQRDIAHYLWMQASRGMLEWKEILSVVRANRKRDHHQRIAHYFGYCEVMDQKGSARDKRLIKLTRYITQEGVCAGCQTEFQFSDLTLDRIIPGKRDGKYELRNVQLMCGFCNNAKDADFRRQTARP